jgi:hypothetical protein
MSDSRHKHFAMLREPLVHFLLFGAILFVVFHWFREAPESERLVRIDLPGVQRWLRSSGLPVPADGTLAFLESLSAEERQQLVQQVVREEVLVREALELALDEGDAAIRQRLVDRMRSMQEQISGASIDPSEEELQHFFDTHTENYRFGATVTFGQVFFDNRNGGRARARQRAVHVRDSLNTLDIPFTEAHRAGDPYLYQPNYVQRSRALVADHFSPSMAESLFALPLEPQRWRGPLESPYGQHVVWIAQRTPDRLPSLDEVRDSVRRDLQRQLVRQNTERAIDALVQRYRVEIDLPISIAGD